MELLHMPDNDLTAQFVFTLAQASTRTVTLSWETRDGTAVGNIDYVPASGQLVFQPGETSKTVVIQVLQPPTEERKFFTVAITGAVNATVDETEPGQVVIMPSNVFRGKRGFKGDRGQRGMTAYEEAVASGAFIGSYADWLDFIRIGIISPSPGRLIRSAHRGYGALAPENTMSSFTNAHRSGADILECDIQISSDGVPVIIHDDTVDRTSNGTGAVKSMTFAQLRALDNGSKYSPKFAGSVIPTLDEVIKFGKSRAVGICAEIKSYRTQADIDLSLAVIANNQAEKVVSLASFNFSDLQYVRARNKRIELCPLSNNIGLLPAAAALGGKVMMLLEYTSVLANPSWVATCRASGVDVGVWTVDNQEDVKKLLSLGVTYIISNVYIGDAS